MPASTRPTALTPVTVIHPLHLPHQGIKQIPAGAVRGVKLQGIAGALAGEKTFQDIAPHAETHARLLLDILDEKDLLALGRIIDKLISRADEITEDSINLEGES